MRPRPGMLALSLCLLILAVAGPAQAAAPVVSLGSFIPNGMNNKGDIVGDAVDFDNDTAPGHAAVWKAGTLTPLAEPAGTTASDAYAINASGRIAGDARNTAGQLHAVFWDGAAGTPQQIGPLSSGPDDFSFASGVDTAGEVVGQTLDTTFLTLGFLRPPGGGLTRVGDADRDDGSTTVAGITPDGTRILGHVGSAAHNGAATGWYLWQSPGASGTKLDITPFPGGSLILGSAQAAQYGNALASDGTVLGYKGETAQDRVYHLRLPGGDETTVGGLVGHNAVNAKHVVAGTILAQDGMGNGIPHAAIWKPGNGGGTVVDLNTLIPADSGYLLFDALTINDNGDIAGLAAHEGQTVGFLLPAGYVVDSTGDTPDTVPGDGACLTAQATCTLRAALQEVSAGPVTTAATSISFNLPGSATTIAPTSALDAATKPVAIDGFTNPGGRVVLDGTGAGGGSAGLRIEGDNSTVRGLDVAHFGGPGIRIHASQVQIGGLPTDTPACAFPCNIVRSSGGPGIVVAGVTDIGDKLLGNRLTGNGIPAIDLGDDGRTPNDRNDADGDANSLHNFPVGVLGAKDPVSLVRKVSGVDRPADAGSQVTVYAQSAVTPLRGAEPTDFVGTTTVTDAGTWALDVPAGLPGADTFFSAVVTHPADGTSELSPVCGDPDGDGNPDTDGDGLCDDWELHGIDGNGDGIADLPIQDPAYGADPAHKDLYLEVDAMEATTGLPMAPQQGAIDSVVAAFARAPVDGGAGVSLHVNPGRPTVDDLIPEDRAMAATGSGPHTLDDIRNGSSGDACDGHFGSAAERTGPDCWKVLAARALAFRYALFAYNYAEGTTSSGRANGLGGDTLTVTLGPVNHTGEIVMGGGLARCKVPDGCRRLVDAGTLMHEFGHLLGLHHGGRDDVNNKPSYLSIMNYLYQFHDLIPDRPLDYSRFALAPLNEAGLTDAAGITGGLSAATLAELTALWPRIGFFEFTPTQGCTPRQVASGGAIDWDADPGTATSVTSIHIDNCALALATLTSTEDWPDLRYSFRDQPGTLKPTAAGASTTEPELSPDAIVARAARSDADRNGVNDLADACREVPGSGFADANGNGFADTCEGDMGRLNAFPTQSSGSGGKGPAKDTTAPKLSKLAARPSVARRARPPKKARPATLRFTVSEASTVTFTGERILKGRRAGRRCVTGARKGKPCLTYKRVTGSLRVTARAGTSTVAFAPKLGAKALKPGMYRLTAVAIDAAGNRSKPATVTVTVR